MDRDVPVAFALLGVVLGTVGQIRNVAPALLHDSTPRSPSVVVFLLGSLLFVLSTIVVALVGYWAGRKVDLADEYARFAVIAGVAGGLGFVVGAAGTFLVSGVSVTHVLFTVIVGVVYSAVTKAVSIGLYGLAGATVAHFSADR